MPTLLLTVDALRADHLSQYGYYRDTMPVLDKWLSEGALFTQAFANGPHTQRSIPSLLTSQYQPDDHFEHGPTVATSLSSAGITTAGFHSNSVISSRYDTIAGFDVYEDFTDQMDEANTTDLNFTPTKAYLAAVRGLTPWIEQVPGIRNIAKFAHNAINDRATLHKFSVYQSAAVLTDKLLEWIDNQSLTDFFLWAHYMDPHRPYGLHPDRLAFADRNPTEDEIRELMPRLVSAPQSISDEDWQRAINWYDSDIRYMSDHIERLFQGLHRRGLWSDMDVIFTSDHGEEFGEHGNSFHRNRGYDELLHVPLIVRRAGQSDGQITKVRELVDIAPTIAGFYEETYMGCKGQDLFTGEDRTVVAVGGAIDNDESVTIRTPDYKYIHNPASDGPFYELYDLNADPKEQNKIEDVELAAKLHDQIPQEVTAANRSFEVSSDSEAARERLKRLGYIE